MGKQIHTDYDFIGGARITGLPASAANGQPVVHEQLAAAIEGIAWKDSVRVSTQGNINLASPGATIDGGTMVIGDRFLTRLQSTVAQNGIHVWNGAATPATRAADASTFAELEGAAVTVEEGTNAGVTYRQTQVNGTIDSSDVVWTTFGAAAGSASETSAGIAELATQAETDAGADDARIVTPLKLKTSPHAAKRFSATFGDGAATQYDLTHNFGTKDVAVAVRKTADDQHVECLVTSLSVNAVRLNFSAAVASNAMRATILA